MKAGELAPDFELSDEDMREISAMASTGGRLTDFSGRATIYDGSVLATNGRLHEQILALLRR